MFRDKRQAKIDVRVEIADGHQAAVTFSGSYVVTARG
jgi:hypothetical protein